MKKGKGEQMKRTGLTMLLAVLFILSVSGSVPAGETADTKVQI